MSNNDKFIRDTEFGKLMEVKENEWACDKCKYLDFVSCRKLTNFLCADNFDYYFAKDETDEKKI